MQGNIIYKDIVYTNLRQGKVRSLVAGRGSGYHGCDYNDILHVLIPPATHHIMRTMPLCQVLEHIRTTLWPLCGWKCLFCYIKLSEEGTHRVDFSAQ